MTITYKSATYEFGEFRVESASFRLLRSGQAVALEPKALELLIFLIQNHGQMVGKAEILNAVWADAFVTENALSRDISMLRKALEDDSRQPKYIETVQGRGYRFIATLKETSPATEDTENRDTRTTGQEMPQARPANISSLWVRRVGLGIAVAGVLLTLGWLLLRGRPHGVTVRRKSQVTFSTGLDIFPTFSPDGNSMAYSSSASGKFEIYIRQMVPGGTEVAVTHDGLQNVEPAWSPNGQWLAYHSRIKRGLWLVSALGGEPRRLTEFGARPAWSPDGSQIAFQSADSDAETAMGTGAPPDATIWTVSVSEGMLRQITQPQAPVQSGVLGHTAPQWSPDGKRILFTNADGIWSASADGGGLSPVLADVFAYDVVYAPDGRSILFASADGEGAGIWAAAIDPKTGAVKGTCHKIHNLSGPVAHHLAISRDGKRLLLSQVITLENLHSVALGPSGGAAGAPIALTEDTRPRKFSPVISPDGGTIAFTVLQQPLPSQIWTMDSNGHHPQQISSSRAAYPGWLPTGDLVWVTAEEKGTAFDVLALDHLSHGVHKIAAIGRGMNAARLSPDGGSFAYQTTVGGVMNVWTVRIDDGIQKQITFGKQSTGWASWSPDGKLLAVEERVGEDTRIGIVPSDGGPIITVVAASGQNWPYSWSPDGDRIAFAGLRDGLWNLYSVSRTTHEETEITSFSRPDIYVRYPEWSPKGDMMVFEYGESKSNVWLLDLE